MHHFIFPVTTQVTLVAIFKSCYLIAPVRIVFFAFTFEVKPGHWEPNYGPRKEDVRFESKSRTGILNRHSEQVAPSAWMLLRSPSRFCLPGASFEL